MNDFENIKLRLDQMTNEYREELLESVNKLIKSLGKKGVNALIISGSLITTYLIVRAITRKDEPDEVEIAEGGIRGNVYYQKPQQESFISKLSNKVFEELLIFLLTLAKDRLLEFIKESKNENPEETKKELSER